MRLSESYESTAALINEFADIYERDGLPLVAQTSSRMGIELRGLAWRIEQSRVEHLRALPARI